MVPFNSLGTTAMLLKNFNFTDILEYCNVLNTAHSCQNYYRQIITKGQAFFKERFVTDIQFKLDKSENFIIRSTVKAEMKKRSAYNLSCAIDSSGKVSVSAIDSSGKVSVCFTMFSSSSVILVLINSNIVHINLMI